MSDVIYNLGAAQGNLENPILLPADYGSVFLETRGTTQTIAVTLEDVFLVRENGDFLVRENGDFLIADVLIYYRADVIQL